MSAAILLVDDDPDVLLAARLALQDLGAPLLEAAGPQPALALLAQQDVAVVLLDMNFQRGHTQGEEGLALLRTLRQRFPQTLVIVVTAHAGLNLAVQAMQLGAQDFIAKPWHHERLQTTVRNALALHHTRGEAARWRQSTQELGRPEGPLLIGQSPAWRHVLGLIEQVAPTEANVLILGENGSGKELVAQALHRASARAQGPLVAVDMGAVAPTLFESELFGHRKGAFTDARADRIGRIAAADGGTLFLDEIGNLPLALQPRLLSVLERREVQPLGSPRAQPVDVRVISATNVSRDALADERQFRADLLWRLNTVEIHVPPLRQRRADIPLLAEHFLRHYTARYGRPPRQFSQAALQAMDAHAWPGNVRALRHAVERAVVLARSERIVPEDLALISPGPALGSAASREAAGGADDAAEDLNLERMERQLVQRALSRNAWNISKAAQQLGLTRAALYRRMQRHGL
ncbi:MAG: sigma-54-dependent Fis family transcriptional regulator [Rubrivivax sp.]|nr:sigma-54-dependent Fis family transcriptional regulator [Rubrivivax sp.]